LPSLQIGRSDIIETVVHPAVQQKHFRPLDERHGEPVHQEAVLQPIPVDPEPQGVAVHDVLVAVWVRVANEIQGIHVARDSQRAVSHDRSGGRAKGSVHEQRQGNCQGHIPPETASTPYLAHCTPPCSYSGGVAPSRVSESPFHTRKSGIMASEKKGGGWLLAAGEWCRRNVRDRGHDIS